MSLKWVVFIWSLMEFGDFDWVCFDRVALKWVQFEFVVIGYVCSMGMFW